MIDYIHNVRRVAEQEGKDEDVKYRKKITGFIFRNSGIDVYWFWRRYRKSSEFEF